MDTKEIKELLQKVREIGEPLKQVKDLHIQSKNGIQDLVTDMDKDTERKVREVLQTFTPECTFIGEEGDQIISDSMWIIDPIDGTTNFINAQEGYAICLAYVKDDYAIMRISHIENDGVFLGKLFQMIADLNINLDTISQQLDDEGKANFSFYCTEEQSRMIMENMDKVGQNYPITRMLGFIKLSLVGLGISTHSGIASKVLNTLRENNIPYYMITSSEISISLTIDAQDKEKAIQVLGKAFDL